MKQQLLFVSIIAIFSVAVALRQIPELQWTQTAPNTFAGTLEYVVQTFQTPGGTIKLRLFCRNDENKSASKTWRR